MSSDPYTILLIGDPSSDTGRIYRVLQERPKLYRLHCASGMDDAVRSARERRPELLFFHVAPENNGVRSALGHFFDLGAAAPAVVATGVTDHEKGEALLHEGVCDYFLQGQIEPALLHRTIRSLVVRGRLASSLHYMDERYRKLLHAVTDYAYSVRIQSGMPISSVHGPGCEAVTGYSAEEYAANPGLWFQMIHDEDRQLVLKTAAQVMSGATPPPAEHRIHHKNGGVRWIKNTLVPQLDHRGKLLAYDGLVTDITERKKAELALRESEERYRLMTENALDVISRLSADGTVLYISPSCRKLLCYEPGEIIGRAAKAFLPQEDFAHIRTAVRAAVREGKESYSVQHRLTRREGGAIWMETMGRLIYTSDGRPLEIQCASRDITDRKQAEEILRYQKALLEAQSETSPDGRLVISPGGTMLFHNQRLCALWGMPQERMTACSEEDFHQFVMDQMTDPDLFREKLFRLRTFPQAKSSDEIRLVDGRVFDCFTSPISGQTGESYGRIWVFRDITDRKKLEEQLRHTHKMECIGLLASGVAHDFNNVLTAVIGFSNLIQLRPENADHAKHCAKEINECCNRAADMVKSLLTFSRKQEMTVRQYDLNDIVARVETMLLQLIGRDIQLSTSSTHAKLFLRGDRTQIEQVIMNLVTNARDAMPTGGSLKLETGLIEASDEDVHSHLVERPGPYATLSVADTGTGMDEEMRQKIFDPFFTTKEVGKGTGLGLSIVYGIVKQHRGSITVESELGHGTRFTVYLPLLSATENTTYSERASAA